MDISFRQMNSRAMMQRKLIREVGLSGVAIIASIKQITQDYINLSRSNP